METWNRNRLDGCLFTAPSPTDYRVEFGTGVAVPRQLDLRPQCTPVENQGEIGSCTANACVGALEYLYARRDGQAPDLSRMFVYYNTRRLKGSLQLDSGATVAEAMAAVLAYGACRSQLWPYNPALFSEEPTTQAYADGRAHEAIQYARVPGLSGAIQALSQGYPVVFGTFIPKRCYEVAATTGVIPTTTTEERQAQPTGGHCMLIVGYDLDRKVLLIRNSWGTDWGNAGYCEFPFEEVVWSCPDDSFWMLVELEPRGKFSVSRSPYNHPQPPGVYSRSLQPAADTADASLAGSSTDLRDQLRGELLSDIDKMRQDLRNSVLSDSLDASAVGAAESQANPGLEHGIPDSALKRDYSEYCAVCNNARRCYYCGGSGHISGDGCWKCSASGRCYACMYW